MPAIMNAMPVNRFEQIKRFVHFSNNDEYNGDKLYKIRPLLNHLKTRYLDVPKEKQLCIDEPIIPFQGRHSLKNYNPQKPHKWGYKVFALSGTSDFTYDVELFTGAADNTQLHGEPNICPSSNVVVRLLRSVPSNMNYRVFFDH